LIEHGLTSLIGL